MAAEDGQIVHVRISRAAHDELLRRQKKLAGQSVYVSVPALVKGIVEDATRKKGTGK